MGSDESANESVLLQGPRRDWMMRLVGFRCRSCQGSQRLCFALKENPGILENEETGRQAHLKDRCWREGCFCLSREEMESS